ncbi:MAG: carboxypeptidase regulatory-like domain-containing protein [Thermoplasmata archaeon]
MRSRATLAAVIMILASGPLLVPSLSTPSTGSASVRVQSGTVHSFPTPIRHVLVIMDENQEYSTVLRYGPFEDQLTETNAVAGNFWSTHHNSPIDYVAAVSGVESVAFNETTPSVADLVGTAGLTWGEYEESMPVACDANTSDTAGQLYTPGHSPFIRFEDVAGSYAVCSSHILTMDAYNQSAADGTVPNYIWVTPNDDDDSHNDNVSVGDAWLRTFISGVENESWFNSTAIFITYDEGSTAVGHFDYGPFGYGGGHIYTAIVSPYARAGYTSPIPYNTFDILTTTEWLLGLGSTGHNDSWSEYPPMFDLFDLNSTYTISGTVTNAGGHPIADATIANSVDNWTQASSAGTYTMPSPNDTWTLTASAPGYAPTIATVTVHGADRTVNFVLQRSYSVSGHATLGSFVTSNVPGAVNKTSVTGTSGTYTLQLPNGTWSLTATLLGYVPKAVNVTVHGANLTGPEITLVRVPASYKYTVRVMNGSTPIAYAWVRVLSGPPPVTDFWPTTPGPSGGFASGVLLNGTYTLEAVRGGFPNATIAATVDGSNVTGVRFSIGAAPPTTYALTVRVVGPTGAPIEGANVTYALDGQTYELGGPTSSAGYTVGELTNGSYSFSASAPGFLITHWNTTISGAPRSTSETLTPAPSVFTLTVRTQASNGTPIAGAMVSYTGSSAGSFPATSSLGTTSALLVNGTYQVTAGASGFVNASTIVVINGSGTNVTFTLSPTPAGLTGIIENDLTSAPVPNASVAYSGVGLSGVNETNGLGEFALLLPPGMYDVEVNAAGYLGQNVSVTLDRAGANLTVGLIPRVVVPSPLYGVSFHEDGLLPNISWSVTLQGTGNGVRSLEVTDSSGDGVVSFTETNGTYGYFVSPVSGYSSSPASGDFLIAGADLSVSVDFQPIAPPPVIEGFSANPSGEITLGNATELSVQVSGGAIPLSYQYSGLPSGCASTNGSTLYCRPTSAGAYNVTATVTDAYGRSDHQSLELIVTGPGSRLTGTSVVSPLRMLLENWMILLPAVGAVLLAVGASIVWRRRTRSGTTRAPSGKGGPTSGARARRAPPPH